MCYKHGPGLSGPTATGNSANQGTGTNLFPKSYFSRLASQQTCPQCQGRVSPEEAKTAVGVCTVFLLNKTVQWITNK